MINKKYSKKAPSKLQDLKSGIWTYNFDIKEDIIETASIGGSIKEPGYSYYSVKIDGTPTVTKCYEAILKEYTNSNGDTLYNLLLAPTVSDEIISLAEDFYEMVQIDFGKKVKPTELEMEKRKAIKAIDDYDVSMEVNSFFLNGLQVWLDKSTRVGLMNSLNIEKLAGKETSTLWFGNIKLDINTGAAIQMLSSLELYALECYNKTAEHKVNIENMTSVEDVINYDFTEGYPDKLNLSV